VEKSASSSGPLSDGYLNEYAARSGYHPLKIRSEPVEILL